MGSLQLRWLFCALLTGCATFGKPADPNLIYRREMALVVNGKKIEGVGVLPRALSYRFEIESRGRLDAFTLTSCSRDELTLDIKEKGLFGSRRRYRFDYLPMAGLEDTSFCQLDLGGYDKETGRHSWALLDFEHPELRASATVYCNGSVVKSVGVSVCQSKIGLYQKIEFSGPTIVEYEKECEIAQSEDGGKTYIFPLRKGICHYAFRELKGAREFHRLTTLGYEGFLMPKGEE